MISSKKVQNIFIGSSAEKLELVEALFLELGSRELLTTHWAQGTSFTVLNTALDSLIKVFNEYDFACFFIDADDVSVIRGDEKNVTRDNVIFEIGLAIGKLGKERVFIIHDRNNKPDLPSDLQGIIFKDYEILNENVRASLAHLAIEIKEEIKDLGQRKDIEKTNKDVCDADWVIIRKEGVSENKIIINNSNDTSDLFFLFLSVTDCEDCRTKIEDIANEYARDYFIDAIYDLLGAWDVLLKFRTNQDALIFKKVIIDTLIEYHIMNKEGNEKYSDYLLVDVKKQTSNIDGLIKYKESEEIFYTVLNNNNDYNKYRASRTFLYMEAPGEFGSNDRKEFLKQLSLKIKDKKNNSIIESFCEGEKEIIIEIFSSCAQTSFINHLHKSIEKFLTKHKLDKSNLSCYFYDESRLIAKSSLKEQV